MAFSVQQRWRVRLPTVALDASSVKVIFDCRGLSIYENLWHYLGTLPNMEASGAPRYVQVPIPEDLVEDVYAFVTERRRRDAGEADSTPPPADSSSDVHGWDEQTLRAFLDQANPKLRTLLTYLAERAGQYVPAREAVTAAGLTPGRSAGGFLSRAAASSRSRFGRELPLDGRWNDEEGRNEYLVSEEHAAVILDQEARRHQD